MNIQIPHDFSWEVPERKCEWAFPVYGVSNFDGVVTSWPLSWTNIRLDTPDICEDCPLQEICTNYVVSELLWEFVPSKEQFNETSNRILRNKKLEDRTSDINELKNCDWKHPWEKWKEWNTEWTDQFDVWEPCRSCSFHISCSVQALRKIDSSYWEPRNEE
jgi:hypothetical protein